jgi:hypothetical protein
MSAQVVTQVINSAPGGYLVQLATGAQVVALPVFGQQVLVGSIVDSVTGQVIIDEIPANMMIIVAATGIVIPSGIVAISPNPTSALALTLPLPSPGAPYQTLQIWDFVGAAHTVTTPADGINGTLHVITFGGTAFTQVTLTAFLGGWLVGPTSGITLS